jgi:hypothetical protein
MMAQSQLVGASFSILFKFGMLPNQRQSPRPTGRPQAAKQHEALSLLVSLSVSLCLRHSLSISPAERGLAAGLLGCDRGCGPYNRHQA